jgi:hypothetical protein
MSGQTPGGQLGNGPGSQNIISEASCEESVASDSFVEVRKPEKDEISPFYAKTDQLQGVSDDNPNYFRKKPKN